LELVKVRVDGLAMLMLSSSKSATVVPFFVPGRGIPELAPTLVFSAELVGLIAILVAEPLPRALAGLRVEIVFFNPVRGLAFPRTGSSNSISLIWCA